MRRELKVYIALENEAGQLVVQGPLELLDRLVTTLAGRGSQPEREAGLGSEPQEARSMRTRAAAGNAATGEGTVNRLAPHWTRSTAPGPRRCSRFQIARRQRRILRARPRANRQLHLGPLRTAHGLVRGSGLRRVGPPRGRRYPAVLPFDAAHRQNTVYEPADGAQRDSRLEELRSDQSRAKAHERTANPRSTSTPFCRSL